VLYPTQVPEGFVVEYARAFAGPEEGAVPHQRAELMLGPGEGVEGTRLRITQISGVMYTPDGVTAVPHQGDGDLVVLHESSEDAERAGAGYWLTGGEIDMVVAVWGPSIPSDDAISQLLASMTATP